MVRPMTNEKFEMTNGKLLAPSFDLRQPGQAGMPVLLVRFISIAVAGGPEFGAVRLGKYFRGQLF